MAVADLKKRLETLERSQQVIAQLALAMDKDVRQEKTRHELIVHLRGDAVDEVQRLFDDHVKSKKFLPITVPRSLEPQQAMTQRRAHWRTPQPGILRLLRRCGSSFGDGSCNPSKLAQRRQRRLAGHSWLWQQQPNFTPMMGRLLFIVVVFTVASPWNVRRWRRFGTSVWISLSLVTASWPCSFLRTISNLFLTKMSLSIGPLLGLAPLPRR